MMLSPDPAVEDDLSWGDPPPRCLLDPLRAGRGPGGAAAAAGEEGPGHARSLSLSREERRRRRRTTARYRSAHASRERVRVEAFNGAFGDLRDLLPILPPDKKLSKIEILRLAMCYISYLSHVLEL
ncbi:helix-loop-helix protein 2 [Gadus morhua]|uniref:helix-loop-helix protein 2 n=1 Tax=Gadus morhua TaxID=8049 RepID=UPI0011B45615|nr:helix-loop-helix protein 1-like [Gadus morhua]XP_030199879.1 helix-loop-helix protein 1-like [Gadus morhua]